MSSENNSTDLLRKALFIPCDTKEALHRWIKIYLGLDFPNCLVDDTSTASPMDVIWEIYSAIREGRPNFTQILAFASRDSFKTLGAAVIEVLVMCHLRWSVAHMAAILPQAQKSQQYVKKFLNRPYLRDYLTSKNDRMTEITRYQHRQTGEYASPSEIKEMDPATQAQYDEIKNYINIIVCTIQGANSEHVPFMVIDEVDVVENPDAYEEAKFIPAPQNGQPPITLLTSTRKYSFGLVQKEIENAVDEDQKIVTHIRHWNIIDVTEACKPDRHLPNDPKITIYRSDETLRALSENDYMSLPLEEKANYVKDTGYAGCLKNCRLFAVCKGKLATEQKSKSKLLKPIEHVIAQFKKVSAEKAKAQLMCWKPSKEGLIYPNFSPDVHMITPAQVAEKVTGDPYPETFSKNDLIDLFISRGARFFSGLDHGFTHNFSVVTGALDGNRFFVVDVISEPELELSQKIDRLTTRLTAMDPTIFPDPEDPASNKTLSKHVRIRNFSKEKGSVIGGIETVRLKLMPAMGNEPELYFLKGDSGCEGLSKAMQGYHWKTDAAGRVTDEPVKEEDDEVDALRYVVMNLFSNKGKLTVAKDEVIEKPVSVQRQYTQTDWMKKVISEHTGQSSDSTQSTEPIKGRKGRFSWDM